MVEILHSSRPIWRNDTFSLSFLKGRFNHARVRIYMDMFTCQYLIMRLLFSRFKQMDRFEFQVLYILKFYDLVDLFYFMSYSINHVFPCNLSIKFWEQKNREKISMQKILIENLPLFQERQHPPIVVLRSLLKFDAYSYRI